MNKNIITSVITVSLFISLLSCKTGSVTYSGVRYRANMTPPCVQQDDKTILCVNHFFNKPDRNRFFVISHSAVETKEIDDYTFTILKEAGLEKATIEFIIPGKLVFLKNINKQTVDYQYIKEDNGQLSAHGVLFGDNDSQIGKCAYYRRIINNPRDARVIVVDYFVNKPDKPCIIYIIQGCSNSANCGKQYSNIPVSVYSMKLWNPALFSNIISTSGFIKTHIDPISKQYTEQDE